MPWIEPREKRISAQRGYKSSPAGKNRLDMKSMKTQRNNYLRLFASLDFKEVIEAVADIVLRGLGSESLSVLIWDPDVETVSDKYYFGKKPRALEGFARELSEELEGKSKFDSKVLSRVPAESLDEPREEGAGQIWSYRVQENEQLCALLLFQSALGECEIESKLSEIPLYTAIANSWEVREIKRENQRLRSRYDDLEDRNADLEEQTRKLIQDLTFKDVLRFRNIERDKLLYEISSAVRSSVEIQPVLQNAVNNLGQKFDLSRCLIIRPSGSQDRLYVYEYHAEHTKPVKELFFSDAGQHFVRCIMEKTAPCELGDGNLGGGQGFDERFIAGFGFLSALIIPLIMRTRTIGAIFLQDCKMDRPWSIDDLTFYGALADHLSVAVENADLHEEKKLQAVTDGLTGVSNRRNFNDCFYKEFERAKRYAEPLTLALVDLDYLKRINDSYGHTAGDDAIKAVASVLSRSSRSVDIVARYGGEEFCLLLPNTLLEESELIAERIRKLINETELDGVPQRISASIGLANFPLHANEPDDLFKRADEALYKAKEGGRNKVVTFECS